MSTDGLVSNQEIVERARRVADDVLFEQATTVDRSDRVPVSNLAALAEAGLFGIGGPTALGCAELDGPTFREVFATIAGGCGATFFVWAQHHGVVRTLRSSGNDELQARLLGPMCVGETIGGVAFAHVRRSDRRAVTARRIDGGWQLDGHAPWATSWGIADWFAVAAESDDGQLVWCMLPGPQHDGHPKGVAASTLDLPVLAATRTVALTFDHCVVPDSCVASLEDADEWRRRDRRRASIGQTAVLGVAERAIQLLGGASRGPEDPAAAAADRLATRLLGLWADDRRLGAALDDGEDVIDSASDHRAACLDMGHRSTRALLAASGGGAMSLTHPAQRLAREAGFYVIQAQTNDGRAATLRAV